MSIGYHRRREVWSPVRRHLIFVSEIDHESDGAVVAAEDLVLDKAVGNLGEEPVGDDEVVDAPSGVAFAGLEHIVKNKKNKSY